ncbi:MAG: hypothetical protein GY927_03145 [bacterium]|nr:hypothetical protein [bacterium]
MIHAFKDVPLEDRWLFPGRRPNLHLTARQFSRIFKETVAAAGIKKQVTLSPAIMTSDRIMS